MLLVGLALALSLAPRSASARQLGAECRLVDVDSVSFRNEGRLGWYLDIGGTRRFANMDVNLMHHPRGGGIWRIEVIGCTKNFIVLPLTTPYYIELPLNDIPAARRLEIVAANGIVRRRVPGR